MYDTQGIPECYTCPVFGVLSSLMILIGEGGREDISMAAAWPELD